ncbi:hypothetical protein TEHD86_1432 [Tetragenococcus halophilus subsp. halophilus]|uniref:Uncharacterized protein n=1 Tax=Tetragenococcus halophilus subsp. halophilus TaxID=1513897 RepID=A0A2H6D096_TETHA|nr:hypothetical protein C7K42_01550 [Tetragenococcus halophilus subsp. halophilus DSM 20339]GBD58946.1 hypothetical protein TEHN0098T_0942 [Tetragenococcus halophilus subsp. halophilus]GFK21823.1 hypothetical protein WJ7_12860 [Tetragenococcus halophilus]GBD67235.1 hypothetical protein TEHN7118_0041 [Tetragenococcus halophilus subsp. halophilus]GBD70669.1 hypothetical protein TEHN7121_1215 [Tetragenococcus halophilus subsp. halophilus]
MRNVRPITLFTAHSLPNLGPKIEFAVFTLLDFGPKDKALALSLSYLGPEVGFADPASFQIKFSASVFFRV